jgi:hypothetical protein
MRARNFPVFSGRENRWRRERQIGIAASGNFVGGWLVFQSKPRLSGASREAPPC